MILPLRDVIFVEKLDDHERTSTGIIILEAKTTDRPAKGIVRFAGPGKKDDPMILKPGDHITFSPFSGEETEVENKRYLVMREADVLCIN